MKEQKSKTPETRAERKPYPTAGVVLDDGALAELVLDPETHRTAFAVWSGESYRTEGTLEHDGQRFVPFSAENNLIRHRAVLLSGLPEQYETVEHLVGEVRAFIHRYVDLGESFESVATQYVLLSWVHDAFSELPYIRVRGDYGSGKTRFLLVVGSLCYRPFFASGASTVSPIFYTLDAFRGTLVIDEADFRMSDEKAEIVKILNNGNARGMPVLRSVVNRYGEYNPRAFHVFGPKLVAARGSFEDRALESRFITEDMGHRPLRDDIPINMPEGWQDEALRLRNKLLLYRFRTFHQTAAAQGTPAEIEPRLRQIYGSLMAVCANGAARDDIREVALRHHRDLVQDRSLDAEAQLLEVVRDLAATTEGNLTLKEIATEFVDRFGADYETAVNSRWVGYILRRRLFLKTRKSHGIFVLPFSERPKLATLLERYGIAAPHAEAEGNQPERRPADVAVDLGETGECR